MTKLARARPRHARSSIARPARRASLAIRSAERRRWSADLTGPGPAALVLYGIGGIGKSTLAAQIAARLTRVTPECAVATVSGEVSPAMFAALPADADLIILDDFDDNLSRQANGCSVADPALAALMAGWTGKLLVTCRAPFTLPSPAGKRLAVRRLGPLTRSGAAELAASLPALRLLGEAERDRVWRLVAGHPLALEYLDALLAKGEPYADLTARIADAVQVRTARPVPRIEPTELPPAEAELVTSAVGDQMFGELFGHLGAGARSMLVRASVFRSPVRPEVVGGRPGQIAECEAARLLTVRTGGELSVHRWTADQLHRRLTGSGLAAQLADAHRQAAAYWRSGAELEPSGHPSPRAELEASHHLRRARDLDRESAPAAAGRQRRRLRRLAAAGAAAALVLSLAVESSHTQSGPHPPPSVQPVRHTAAAAEASALRDRAAGWVASEVSVGAILACDPAMCAVLARHGVPAGNLLVLGPGATDPLGSNVVLATAALRGTFGSRLTSVYAPMIMASFGTGQARIDVLAVAPDGAPAYLTALAADLRARRAAGRELLQDPRLRFSTSARAQLTAGQPDARLLMTLAALAVSGPVQVLGFGDVGPRATPGMPLRAVQIAVPAAAAPNILAFLRAQRPPYLAAHVGIDEPTDRTAPTARSVLTIEFAAPAPLGLLQPQPSH